MPGSTTIPTFPLLGGDSIMGQNPVVWWGTDDRDGTASPWKDVGAGSMYLYMNSATPTLYIKDALNDANADWGTIDFTT